MKIDVDLKNEAKIISKRFNIPVEILENFAKVAICRVKPPKALTITQLKKAVWKYFGVSSTDKLKKLESFQMATDGMEKLNLGTKKSWEILYRKFIDVLPNEEWEVGHGCINGINIFKYNLPWKTFGLDPKTSSEEEIKNAYRELSKIYHPDVPETGDATIFDRINLFYRTLTATA